MTAAPTHTTDIALRASGSTMQVGAGQMQANEFEAIERQANMLAGSSIVPQQFRNKPADIVAVAAVGREVGLSVMASMQSIHIIEGKPSMSAQLMGALIRARGHSLAITKLEDDVVEMVGTRVDNGNSMRFSFSMADAVAAKLAHKDNWKKYFRAMATARCITQIARTLFADVIAGISYSPEEAADIAGVPVAVDLEGEVVAIAGEVIPNRVPPVAVEPDSTPESNPPAEDPAEFADEARHAEIKALVSGLTPEERPFVAVHAKNIGASWTLGEMTTEAADNIEAFIAREFPPVEEERLEGEIEEPAVDAGVQALVDELDAEPVESEPRVAANGATIPPNPVTRAVSSRRRQPTATTSA